MSRSFAVLSLINGNWNDAWNQPARPWRFESIVDAEAEIKDALDLMPDMTRGDFKIVRPNGDGFDDCPSVSILFGADLEEGDEAETFTFATQAELDAFLKAVDLATGYSAARVVNAGYVIPESGYDEADSGESEAWIY